MRFMMLMIPKGYERAEPDFAPNPEAMEAMTKYNESMQKAGVMLSCEGLRPPSVGARVTFKGGKPTVSHGPFPEAQETLGGFWLLQVNSQEEALDWAQRCPASDTETIEVRQVQEMEDFPDDIPDIAKLSATKAPQQRQPGI